MMKKIFVGIAILFLVHSSISAQQRGQRAANQEKIQAFKVSFFTEKLQLSPAEAEKFWPLFNQFEKDKKALRSKYDKKGSRIELLSDNEVKDYILRQMEKEQEMIDLRKGYIMDFMDVLPIRKVAMLQRIDREYKKAILDEIRNRRQGRKAGN